MKRALALLVAGALGAIPALDACRDPTYVSVHLTTDVPCERVQGVTVTVGTLGALEDKIPATRATTCKDGEIGTISLVPTGGNEDELGVRVVMGIGRDVESCTAPAYGDGCVVARRGLHYLSHQALTLPIALRQICNGIPCGAYETCVKGVCKSAKIEDPAKCTTPDGCEEDTLVDVFPDGGVPTSDGGPTSINDWCGSTSVVDVTSPNPMKGGCPTMAGRYAGLGPASATPEDLDDAVWGSLATTLVSNELFGTRSVDGGAPAFAALAMETKTLQSQPSGNVGQDGSCAILQTRTLCVVTGKLLTVASDGAVTATPYDVDGGPTGTLKSWNVGKDETVYAELLSATNGFQVFAISKTGAVLWKVDLGQPTAIVPPVVSADEATVYLATESQIVAVDAVSGVVQWTQNASAKALAVHLPAKVLVAVVEGGALSYTLQRFTFDGTVSGSVPLQQTLSATTAWSMAMGPDNTVILLRNGRLEAVDFYGSVRWGKGDANFGSGDPLIVDVADYLYTLIDGQVASLDAHTGSIRWQHNPVDSPVISGLAFGTGGKLLYAGIKLRRLH